MLAAICYVDDVVLVVASVAVADVMVAEVIAELLEVGLTVGAEKTHWTSQPKDDGHEHWSVVGRGAGICGIEVVFGWKCKERDCTQICSSEQVSGDMETHSEFIMAKRKLRLSIVKSTVWHAFLWSSTAWTRVKAQRDKIASWIAREVANVIGVKKPPWMEMETFAQDWSPLDREMQLNVLTAIREQVLCWSGVTVPEWIARKFARRP